MTETRLLPLLQLIRFDKPIGTWLLLWPTLAALWLAQAGLPSRQLLVIFSLGAFLMRSCGCILNDVADRHLDGHVSRTQHRPLVTGALSVWHALFFAGLLLGLAGLLVLQLNQRCLGIALIGVVMVPLYPFAKRITHFPQVFLGATFNLGVLMAFAAIQNQLPWQAWYWYLIAMLWTIQFDTLYAMADRHDDLRCGIKSTAIALGDYDVNFIRGCQGIIIGLLLGYGYAQALSWPYYLGVLSTTAAFLYQQYLIHDRAPEKCLRAFKNNHLAWLFLLCGIALALR